MDKHTIRKAVEQGVRDAEREPVSLLMLNENLMFLLYPSSIGLAIIALAHQSWIAYVVGVIAIWISSRYAPIVSSVLSSLVGGYVTYIFLDFIYKGSASFWEILPEALLAFVSCLVISLFMYWQSSR